jgi:hypothetical protein
MTIMGQSEPSLCDFDSHNGRFWRIQLSSPRTKTNFCLALKQARVNWKSSVQVQVTAGRELPAGRDSKFVLVGVYRVEVCRCALDCPEGIRRQLVSEATAQRPSLSLEERGARGLVCCLVTWTHAAAPDENDGSIGLVSCLLGATITCNDT